MLGESLRERFGERPEVPIKQEAIKLLASDTRLNILKMLDQRRMTVSELARALELNKSTVHEHLGKMVDGGLLRRDASEEREWVYYELTRTGKYVLQPASARFVLVMAMGVFAGLVALAMAHMLLAGPALAVHADEPIVAAGEARDWEIQVTGSGILGFRSPVDGARLYLLDAEQAADYQFTEVVPADARALGPLDGLARAGAGRYTFEAALEPGVHYLLARGPSGAAAMVPLRAAAAEVAPENPTLLVGVDSPQVEVEVRLLDKPAAAGMVQAVDEDGRELAKAPVLNGRATMRLEGVVDDVRFRFQPAAPGSAFMDAEGLIHAARPQVAFTPEVLPTLTPAGLRVVVDDPSKGPRAGAPVTVVRAADGQQVASATTDATGSGEIPLRILEPGEFVVKAGDLEVGRVLAKPGLRVWVSPGPLWEGEVVQLRTLRLGAEPEPVPGVEVRIDGREVGTTDADGFLSLQFGLGGQYTLQAFREGYLPGRTLVDVLPRTGYVLPPSTPIGLALGVLDGAALDLLPGSRLEVEDPELRPGEPAVVRAFLVNRDSLPRVLRAELKVDGAVVEVQGVPARPGQGAWVTFEFTPEAAGKHAVQVNDLPPVEVQVLRGPPAARLTAASLAVPGLEPLLGIAVALACAGRALRGPRQD